MATFKHIATEAQAKKSKGNWKISSSSPLFDLAILKKNQCRLLQLPGEIRNHIYNLVFDAPVIVEMVSDKVSTDFWYQTAHGRPRDAVIVRFPKRLGNHALHGECSAHWKQSRFALLLTCRQIYSESAPILYKSTAFVFHSACRLRNFLVSVRPFCLAAVKSIYFHHTTYGHPKFPVDEAWKAGHLRKLLNTIGRCVSLMKSVTNLQLSLQVDEVPLRLSLDEYWVKPFLKFAALPLRHVHVIMHDIRAVADGAKGTMLTLRSAFAIALERWLMGGRSEPSSNYSLNFDDLSIDNRLLLKYSIG